MVSGRCHSVGSTVTAQYVIPLRVTSDTVDPDQRDYVVTSLLHELVNEARKGGGWPGTPTVQWLVQLDNVDQWMGPRATCVVAAPLLRVPPGWREIHP